MVDAARFTPTGGRCSWRATGSSSAVRGYFADHDFVLMVDPPGLQRSPGNETHLHAFATEMIGNDGAWETMYLHTSPEFSMKKLLAAGERRIASARACVAQPGAERAAPSGVHDAGVVSGERAYDAVIADCVALLPDRGGGDRA